MDVDGAREATRDAAARHRPRATVKRGASSSIDRGLGRTAALQFHQLATGLVAPATKTEIARIVGENRQNYGAYLAGRSAITLDHVATWIARWEVAQHPPLVLVITGCAVTVDAVYAGTDETRATLANEQGIGDPPTPGWWFDPGTDAWNRPAPTIAERYTVAATEVRGRWVWWRGVRRYGASDNAVIVASARAGMIAADADRLAVKP